MSETAYLIVAIGSLTTAVVTLWFKNERLHKRYHDIANENLVKMTQTMTDNKRVVEANIHVTNEVKDLLHSVNENILELKFKNKK